MRAIITGAGGGIGSAVADALATLPDARLLIVDRNVERGRAGVARLRLLGAKARAFAGDITDPAIPAEAVAAAAESFGGLDAIVSAAGSIAHGGVLADLKLADFEASFAINARPTFLLGQAAHALLAASRGAVVAISSTARRHPVPGLGAYSASKAALFMLVRQMALEWGPDGIRVNCVSPGPTVTPMAPAYADPAVRARRASTLPLRRLSEPEDIAAAVLFLLGPGATGITGTEIEIDGGMGLTTMQLSGSALGRAGV